MQKQVSADPIFDTESGCVPPERRLWRAVIAQAAVDIIHPQSGTNSAFDKSSALSFLTGRSHGFHVICAAAGYDSDWAYDKITKFLSSRDDQSSAHRWRVS